MMAGRLAQLLGRRSDLFLTTFKTTPATHRRLISALGVGMLGVTLGAVSVQAAPINYGNFVAPPGVTFGGVTESSATDATPLYGAPTTFTTGLDFDPQAFASFASNTGADVTDGQLNFSLTVPTGLNSLTMSEAGDYTLAGSGSTATTANAALTFTITVTAINGAPVAPFNLAPVTASSTHNLTANPGSGLGYTLSLADVIAGQLPSGQLITGANVVVDDTLSTTSQTGTIAFIDKTDFKITVNAVPEPATAGLLLVGGLATAGKLRRRRSI